MEISLLIVIDRRTLYLAVLQELRHIFITPLQYWIDGFDMVLLAAVELALRWFVVSLITGTALSLADTHHALVEHLVLFGEPAAKAHEPVGKSVLFDELEEGLFRL